MEGRNTMRGGSSGGSAEWITSGFDQTKRTKKHENPLVIRCNYLLKRSEAQNCSHPGWRTSPLDENHFKMNVEENRP
jgi:hypothetical protein